MTTGLGDSTATSVDAALLPRAAAGERGALGTLVGKYQVFCFRVAARHARNDAEAADCVQDAFVYLITNAGRIELRAKLTTLLYPVLVNAARARVRKDKSLKFREVPVPQGTRYETTVPER